MAPPNKAAKVKRGRLGGRLRAAPRCPIRADTELIKMKTAEMAAAVLGGAQRQ
jgi:hypothetical protein